jgi:hypothetical protein
MKANGRNLLCGIDHNSRGSGHVTWPMFNAWCVMISDHVLMTTLCVTGEFVLLFTTACDITSKATVPTKSPKGI